MKLFAAIFSFFIAIIGSHAQTLKKVPIANTGCSVYAYCELNFDKSFSPDSSTIYVAECAAGEMNYGVICVKLSLPTDSLNIAENTLISYLDYLKSNLNITEAVGYGKGHRLNNNEKTRGVLDYWKDSDKNNWKIKAWTDGKFFGVLYGYSLKELPEAKLNVFLEGFRFPGMK